MILLTRSHRRPRGSLWFRSDYAGSLIGVRDADLEARGRLGRFSQCRPRARDPRTRPEGRGQPHQQCRRVAIAARSAGLARARDQAAGPRGGPFHPADQRAARDAGSAARPAARALPRLWLGEHQSARRLQHAPRASRQSLVGGLLRRHRTAQPRHADERADRAARSEPRGHFRAHAGVQHGPADADPAAGGHDARVPRMDRAQRAPVLRRGTPHLDRDQCRDRERDRHKAGTYLSSGLARSWKWTTFGVWPLPPSICALELPA